MPCMYEVATPRRNCSPFVPRGINAQLPDGAVFGSKKPILVIGETGFEPATARPPAGCATRLRHSPWLGFRFYGYLARGSVPWRCEHTFVPEPNSRRRCGRCGELKPLSAFSWRRRARLQRDNYCRPCRADYKREHYLANRERYIAAAARRREALIAERMRFLVEFLRERPCADCGETDPVVLEFDHLTAKAFGISVGLRNHRWDDVLREIDKCEVVCANCHRRRTASRGGFARAAVAQR